MAAIIIIDIIIVVVVVVVSCQSMNQHTRELISAPNTEHKHNKDLSHLR